MPIGSSDQTSVVNAALAELGSTQRVTSINDESNIARRAKALWTETAEYLLSLHPWNPAIARATLNRSDNPDAPPVNRFQLPADCLRWLPGAAADDDYVDAEREGDYLLSASETLTIRYIRRELDPRKWSPGMVKMMTLYLAMAMADGVTQSKNIQRDLRERAEGPYGDGGVLAKAKRADGLETGRRRRPQSIARSDWLDARAGYGRRW